MLLALVTFNSINMFVPSKIGRHSEAEVFHRVDMLKLVSMHSIVINGRLVFSGDADDFAFVGVELHHPFAFPFSKFVEDFLQELCIFSIFNCHVNHGVISK